MSNLPPILLCLLSVVTAAAQNSGDRYPVVSPEDKVGFIDSQGKQIIAPTFFNVGDMAHFRDGLAPVMVKEGGGYIDTEGHFVIGPNPDFGQPRQFHEGFATLLLWGRNGAPNTVAMIDRQGNIVKSGVPEGPHFSQGLLAFSANGKWGFVDPGFRWIIPAKYQYAWDFSEGVAPVSLGGKYGYVNHKGKEVVPPKYDMDWGFSDGLGRVRLDLSTGRMFHTTEGPRPQYREQYGFVNNQGDEVIPPQFEGATDFHEGRAFAIAPASRRWGIIDKQGRFVLEPLFDQAGEFHDNRAPVRVGDQWGYVDRDGQWVVTPQFTGANDFSNGLARVAWAGSYGYINTAGVTVWRSSAKPSETTR